MACVPGVPGAPGALAAAGHLLTPPLSAPVNRCDVGRRHRSAVPSWWCGMSGCRLGRPRAADLAQRRGRPRARVSSPADRAERSPEHEGVVLTTEAETLVVGVDHAGGREDPGEAASSE